MRHGVLREVVDHLGETVGVGIDRHVAHLPELEVAIGREAQRVEHVVHVVPQLDRPHGEWAALLGLGQQQQIVHEPLHPLGLRAHETRDPRHVLARHVGLASQHLELAPHHGQRRAQLVRRVRHERALARERVVQAVEHVVERLGEKADLVAGAGGAHAMRDVAGVHLGRGARHAPQRARHARRHEIAGHGRGQEREQAGEQERTGHAVLRVIGRISERDLVASRAKA